MILYMQGHRFKLLTPNPKTDDNMAQKHQQEHQCYNGWTRLVFNPSNPARVQNVYTSVITTRLDHTWSQ